jgi:hypothetical protein
MEIRHQEEDEQSHWRILLKTKTSFPDGMWTRTLTWIGASLVRREKTTISSTRWCRQRAPCTVVLVIAGTETKQSRRQANRLLHAPARSRRSLRFRVIRIALSLTSFFGPSGHFNPDTQSNGRDRFPLNRSCRSNAPRSWNLDLCAQLRCSRQHDCNLRQGERAPRTDRRTASSRQHKQV